MLLKNCSTLLSTDLKVLRMTNPNEILNEYAKFLGIARRQGVGVPLWDGQALELLDKAEDTAHEIAHWLIATPEARKLPNYGWNWDWKYKERIDDGKMQLPDGDALEHLTCMLQLAMMLRVGDATVPEVWERYDYALNGVIEDRSWVSSGRREVQSYVEDFALWLNRFQILSSEGTS